MRELLRRLWAWLDDGPDPYAGADEYLNRQREARQAEIANLRAERADLLTAEQNAERGLPTMEAARRGVLP